MRLLIARPYNSMVSSTVLCTSVCNNTSFNAFNTIVLHSCPLSGATESILQLVGISDAAAQLPPSEQCFVWQEIASPKVHDLPHTHRSCNLGWGNFWFMQAYKDLASLPQFWTTWKGHSSSWVPHWISWNLCYIFTVGQFPPLPNPAFLTSLHTLLSASYLSPVYLVHGSLHLKSFSKRSNLRQLVLGVVLASKL